MSTKAKLTLAATSLGAIGIIIFVHHGQKVEKAVCYTQISSNKYISNKSGRQCTQASFATWNNKG